MWHLLLKYFILLVMVSSQTVGQSVCSYHLNYDICLKHMSQQSEPACQTVNLVVAVDDSSDDSLVMMLTAIQWKEESIDDVTVKIDVLNYTDEIETSRRISGHFYALSKRLIKYQSIGMSSKN